LIFVLALVFGVRLITVRTLDAPMWGDSYQHTMMTQLLLDNGGLFTSWQPYAELESFTYHFGFHTIVAAFCWLIGMEAVQAVIWVGQILNGLGVFVLFVLAKRVGGNHWAGTIAVLVAGLLSPMPMYYVNWGRYTQLAGQVILPAAIFLTWSTLETPRRDWKSIYLTWLTVGGLALVHYRVLIFYIVFVVAWMLLSLRKENWMRGISRLCLLTLGGTLLFFPRFMQIWGGGILRNFGLQMSTKPAQISSFIQEYNAIGALSTYFAPMGWLLLAVAVAWGLWQRRREVSLISLWWFLLLIATNPDWLCLPGSGAISNFAIFIAAYIPSGVLIGYLVSQISMHWKRSGDVLVVVVLSVGLLGSGARLKDANVSQGTLVTRPDLRAMAWVRENTQPDAYFLINSFFAYGDSSVVGSDGGWWMPLLGGRDNSVPPLNYGTEEGPWPGYREWINVLTKQVQEHGVDSLSTLEMLRDHGVTHVYIGQRQGRVNYSGPHSLDPQAFLDHDAYRLIYHQDRVWIFKVLR
jgi:hypothetical protein